MKRVLITLVLCLVARQTLAEVSLDTSADTAALGLSTTEQAWLEQHPVIRLAPDPNFAPIEWFNQQSDYNGVSSDYVRLLQERLGIRFEIIRGKSWNQILAMVRRGEVDALSAVIDTPEREQYLAFTKPYFTAKRVIFATRPMGIIEKLGDLKGYKIAVVEGSWMDEKLSQRADMSVNRFQDLSTALTATSLGVTDIVGSSLDTMAFTRRKEGLTNLQLVGELKNQMALSFAVSRELAPLAGILDKALATISATEAAAIRARWIEVDEPPFWEKPLYRNIALGVAVVLLSFVAIVLFWNRTLNARVLERSRQLEDAQIQLIQAEKMESVGRLSAGVAHEVKNPLAIIQMGADYLAEVIPPEIGVQEVIDDIDDAVRRADQVIKGLLDFSHSDKLTLTVGDINSLIEESLRLVAHEFQQRKIEINAQLAPTNPPVRMDANKIQQVLINMLMNAAHAVGSDGVVSISCTVESVADDGRSSLFQPGEPVLRISILDTGPGINKEDLDRLFDPFFSTKPIGEGTGLGLSVSRNIVELHSGRLDICNAPEGGAMVTMDFKLERNDLI